MSQARSSETHRTATEPDDVEGQADSATIDSRRRHFLFAAAATTGAIGIGFAAWPFLASLQPSARAQSEGAPVSVDVSRLAPGEQVTVLWRGKPVWVLRRSPEMLERMRHEHWIETLRDPDSLVETQQPEYVQNPVRSLRPDIFVAVAFCTHLGCVPLFEPAAVSRSFDENWMGGYFCPCHGSRFDLAGRVTKNVPAPTNLVVPPHRYIRPDLLEIGIDHA